MNNFANADTFFAAQFVLNTESIYLAARRFNNGHQLRNLLIDAQAAGMLGDDIDISEIEMDEVLDAVLI